MAYDEVHLNTLVETYCIIVQGKSLVLKEFHPSYPSQPTGVANIIHISARPADAMRSTPRVKVIRYVRRVLAAEHFRIIANDLLQPSTRTCRLQFIYLESDRDFWGSF